MLKIMSIFPPEWQELLKDYISFFTCQPFFCVIELTFLTTRILLLHLFDNFIDSIKPQGVDLILASLLKGCFECVSITIIILFVFAHAIIIVKWISKRLRKSKSQLVSKNLSSKINLSERVEKFKTCAEGAERR